MNDRRSFLILAITFLLAAGMCIGCGSAVKKPSNLPELVPCIITLTQEGAPLSDATIEFISCKEGANYAWFIAGNTDSNGKAVLITQGNFPGCPKGEFKVVVSKENGVTEATSDGMSKTKVFSLVDKKYTSSETTPLSLVVGDNPITTTMDLGKKTDTLLRENIF